MTHSIVVHRKPTSTQLLARILDTPDLAAQVQSLPAPALAKLIEHVGLEDAGEIVALATTAQIADVWDEDLWRADRIGDDERFDGDRFVVWLAVMREAGDRHVAEKLAELPEELVVLAFHGEVLVLGMNELASDLGDGGDDAEAVEKALSDQLTEEIDEYLLVSRRHEGWDDVIAALVALDEHDHDLALRVLERCRKASQAATEDEGGLYEVLSEIESLTSDVAGDREDRRGEMGFVAPSSATAFLRLAREGHETKSTEHDPVTKAYLRGLSTKAQQPSSRKPATARTDLVALLAEAEGKDRDAAPVALLPPAQRRAAPQDAPSETLLVRAMRELANQDAALFAARSDEIAYLANVLRAGWAHDGRRLRPVEAIAAALAVVDQGLGAVAAAPRSAEHDLFARALRVLVEHPADGLFRIAWKALHEDPRRVKALFARVTSELGTSKQP